MLHDPPAAQATACPRPRTATAAAGVERTPIWLDEAPSLDGIRVLVVEDDADARELVGDDPGALRRATSSTAAIGRRRLRRRFSRTRPDVLISDIEMPDEDGYTFIRRIRALDAGAGGATCRRRRSPPTPVPPIA